MEILLLWVWPLFVLAVLYVFSLSVTRKDRKHNGAPAENLRIVLPEGGDADLESLMRFWRDQKPYKVREG